MTTETARLLPMASTGCACCAPADDTPENAPVSSGEDTSAATTAAYQVEGMTCGHCAGAVTQAVTALEGVTEVRIELVPGVTSTVTVTSDRPVAAAAVRAAVEEAGYTLTDA